MHMHRVASCVLSSAHKGLREERVVMRCDFDVQVPDKRLDVLSELTSSERTVPTTVEFVDIAGLVKGASKGEGLGNKFLANIRECNSIVQARAPSASVLQGAAIDCPPHPVCVTSSNMLNDARLTTPASFTTPTLFAGGAVFR